jgi:hypothetical protein
MKSLELKVLNLKGLNEKILERMDKFEEKINTLSKSDDVKSERINELKSTVNQLIKKVN